MIPRIKLSQTFISISIVLVLACLLILGLSAKQQVSITGLMNEFVSNYYQPRVNMAQAGKVAGINGNYYFYFLIITSASILAILNFILRRKSKIYLPHAVMVSAITVLSLNLVLLLIGHYTTYSHAISFYNDLTLEQKKENLFKAPYVFARYANNTLKGRCTAEFITDLDINKDPGMFIERILNYNLYPIDIRNLREEPADCLVVFAKDNPQKLVPENYKIILLLDNYHLLAVKDK